MRALLLLPLLLTACYVPPPCTHALCLRRLDGVYHVDGWNRSVTVSTGMAPVPIVSDSEVQILSGAVEFAVSTNTVRAESGAAFRFEMSTTPYLAPLVIVSSGAVSVSSVPVPPGTSFRLPKAR